MAEEQIIQKKLYKFNDFTRLKTKINRKKKHSNKPNKSEKSNELFKERQIFLMLLKRLFPTKSQTQGTRIKILTPEQMFQRLPKTLAQLKSGFNLNNLTNEIV